MMDFTFKKEERLCSRQLIDRLYTEGRRLMAFPYSVTWLATAASASFPAQVLIVAPKRKFKHAVDRNLVRRLTRECYRLRKHTLYSFLKENGISIVFSMTYIHNEIMSYEQLGKKMDKLLDLLAKDITATL